MSPKSGIRLKLYLQIHFNRGQWQIVGEAKKDMKNDKDMEKLIFFSGFFSYGPCARDLQFSLFSPPVFEMCGIRSLVAVVVVVALVW